MPEAEKRLLRPRVRGKSTRRLRSVLGMAGAASIIAAGAIIPTAAHAAPPTAGEYTGTSSSDNDVTFRVDDSGILTDFNAQVYCFAGTMVFPLIISDGPDIAVEAGEPFSHEWITHDDAARFKVEGIINADGTAAGEMEGSTLDGQGEVACLGASYEWTASLDGEDPDPVYDPEASVTPSTIYESELTDSGVTITGEGFAPESDVTLTIEGTEAGAEAADSDGDVSFVYFGPLAAGSYEAVLSAAEGTATTSFTVTEDPVIYDPDAAVQPDPVTESDLAEHGVTIFGNGFAPNSTVAFTVNGDEIGTADADTNGTASIEYFGPLAAGTYEAVLSAAEGTATTSFTVTEDAEDPDPVYDPEASVSPAELSESELTDSGVTITGEGFAPESDVTLTIEGAEASAKAADSDGDVSFVYFGPLNAGTYEAVLSAAEGTATTSFTVIEDVEDPDPVYDPEASVHPAELSESELADTGITVTGEGFPAHTEVIFSFDDEDVLTATSNANGDVEFEYSGTHVAGIYTLVLSTSDVSADATLTVTEDPDTGTIPGSEPAEEDLDPALEGAIIVPTEAEAGETIPVAVTGFAEGTEVGVWLFSDPVYLGAHTVDTDGNVSVTIPTNTTLGEHTIGVWNGSDDQLIGWDTITIITDDENGGEDPDGNEDNDGDDPGSGDGTDSTDPGAEDDSRLPQTGGSIPTTLIGLATLLLAAGTSVVLFTRRRSMN